MRYFDMHHLSTHDGPGMRTTVFLKGCSLHCPWCHNPESIDYTIFPWWLSKKCILCGTCVHACKQNAIKIVSEDKGQRISIDYKLCEVKGDCVQACPTGALQFVGKDATLAQILEEIIKNKPFFMNADGGVTISGGEPLLQSKELVFLLKELASQGIHTALDTAGAAPVENMYALLPYLDLVLFDLKIYDLEKAVTVLGKSSCYVRDNFEVVVNSLQKTGKPNIWIRTPIIPGYTDSEENIINLAEYINTMPVIIEKWELLSFNPLGKEKYYRLNQPWEFGQTDLLPTKRMKYLADLAKNKAKNITTVNWTGLTHE